MTHIGSQTPTNIPLDYFQNSKNLLDCQTNSNVFPHPNSNVFPHPNSNVFTPPMYIVRHVSQVRLPQIFHFVTSKILLDCQTNSHICTHTNSIVFTHPMCDKYRKSDSHKYFTLLRRKFDLITSKIRKFDLVTSKIRKFDLIIKQIQMYSHTLHTPYISVMRCVDVM